MSTVAGARYAVLANRTTGDLKTVTLDDALGLIALGEWMLVCREHAADAYPDQVDADAFLVKTKAIVRCTHGENTGKCPRAFSIRLLPPDRWTADDMVHLEAKASEAFNTDCLMWAIRVTNDGDDPKTLITITPGRTREAARDGEFYHDMHAIDIAFDGHASAATLAWLMRQSVRMSVSLVTDPGETATSGGWREPEAEPIASMPTPPRRRGRPRKVQNTAAAPAEPAVYSNLRMIERASAEVFRSVSRTVAAVVVKMQEAEGH